MLSSFPRLRRGSIASFAILISLSVGVLASGTSAAFADGGGHGPLVGGVLNGSPTASGNCVAVFGDASCTNHASGSNTSAGSDHGVVGGVLNGSPVASSTCVAVFGDASCTNHASGSNTSPGADHEVVVGVLNGSGSVEQLRRRLWRRFLHESRARRQLHWRRAQRFTDRLRQLCGGWWRRVLRQRLDHPDPMHERRRLPANADLHRNGHLPADSGLHRNGHLPANDLRRDGHLPANHLHRDGRLPAGDFLRKPERLRADGPHAWFDRRRPGARTGSGFEPCDNASAQRELRSCRSAFDQRGCVERARHPDRGPGATERWRWPRSQ